MRLIRLGFTLVAAGIFATAAFASSLQDFEINVDGTFYAPFYGDTLAEVPGLDTSGFNATTGQGTLTLTFDPGTAGTFNIGAWFFDPVGVPFYNEYGQVNGAPDAGQSYQIDIPEYDATSNNLGSGTIVDNLEAGTLDDTNSVPGTTDNYLFQCGANTSGGTANPDCNDLVSMAMGFSFSLLANQEEVITLDLSPTDPGGFSLEDVHPVDGSNTSASAIFYSGSASTVCASDCGVSSVPEPSYSSFGALAFVGLALIMRRYLLKRV